MAYLGLSPVSVGLYTVLNVAGLTALTNFYGDALPQTPTFPCTWYEVQEADARGMGSGYGIPEIEVMVHTASTYTGFKEAQAANQKVIELLRDQTLTVSGYAMCGKVFYEQTQPMPEAEINGVPVREIVSMFRLWVQES